MVLDTDPRRVEAVVRIDESWLRFVDPFRIVHAADVASVGYTIATVERLTIARSVWAVGFVSYEAGAAYGLRVHAPHDVPLAWFAMFDRHPERLTDLSNWCRADGESSSDLGPMTPTVTPQRGVHAPSPLHRFRRDDVDDVCLWNPGGEVSESTIADIVVEISGVRVTPPIACGLLAGTFRAELRERGAITERVVRIEELRSASRCWLVNSVQGWREAALVG